MNMEQLTQNSRQALQRAQSIAIEYGHQQVDQEHLAKALTEDKNGLIAQLLTSAGYDADSMVRAVEEALGRIARVSGPGRDPDKIYISAELDKALQEAEARAKQMKD